MTDPQHSHRRGNPGPIVLLLGAFVLVNLITPAVLQKSNSPESPMMLFLGMIVGQPGLLAVWAVLGPQRLLVRMPVSLLVTTSLWGVFLLGMVMADRGPPNFGEAAGVTLMLPLVFLAVQFPIWILRIATGWRIVVGGTEDDSSSSQSRQFRLQHMLGATTVIAVALGLARLGLPSLGPPNGNADLDMWSGLMFACLLFGVWSAFSTLPCVWAAFVARSKTAGALIIAVYVVLMSVLVVIVLSVIVRPPPSFVEGMKVSALFHGSLAFVLLGSLHLARLCGYVLLRPGRMQPPERAVGTSPFADSSEPPPSATPNGVETEPNP